MHRRTCSTATSRAGVSAVWVILVSCGLLTPVRDVGADDLTGAWQRQLAQIEHGFRAAKPEDAADRTALETKAKELRAEIEFWLQSYPPAAADARPWLDPAARVRRLDDLAVEIGALRAVIARVSASLGSGGDGAFFLGRMEVSVTANASVAATAEMAPAGAAVVDATEIASHDRVALSGALALAPGVSFARVGQRNETTVFVRGFDIRQVPVFVDGIPVYTPYDGYADLERFTTFDMAELQVSKGFTSVIYGANALGGAINVVSRRPSARLEGTTGAFMGSGSARNGFVNLGSRASWWYVQGGGSYLAADHMPMSDAFTPVTYEDGGSRDNSLRRDGKFNVKLGFTPGGSGEYAVSYVGQRGEKGNPPYAGTDSSVRVRYWRWPYWDKDSLYVISNTSLGKAGYLRGRVFHDIYRNMLYSFDDATYTTQVRSSSFKSPYHDTTTGGSVEWGTSLAGRHTLRAAMHLKQDDHQERNIGEPVREQQGWITSVGVEDSIAVASRVSLVTGIGYDRQTTTKAQGIEQGAVVDVPRGTTSGVNPQAGLFWSVPTGMMRLTASRKTRLPSMKDRFSYKFGTAVPNPLLSPERATTIETGYQGAFGSRTSLQASVFYSRITDLIQRFVLGPNLSQQQNIGRASSAGIEVDVRHRVRQQFELAGNYTFLDRDNLSAPTVLLTETPRHKGLLSVTVGPYYRLRGMVSVDAESGRQTLNEGAHHLDVPSFAVLHARLSCTVYHGLDVDVSGSNLTDRNYWIADGYPEAGRMVRLSMRYRF